MLFLFCYNAHSNVQLCHIRGNENGSLAYEMLDGLSVGHNLVWNLTYQTKLFEYLQLNLQYDGRVTNDRKLIHTGFIQLKAFF